MGQSGGREDTPFDISKISELVRLMSENELSEIDLRWQQARVRLRRGSDNVVTTTVAPAMPFPPAAAAPVVPSAPPANEPTHEVLTIDSPIVGTFYTASSPDAEAFVKVGSKVAADTVVCIVEAMKVFNEIPAGLSGTVAKVLVDNGAAVEYGQPLFEVEP